MTAAALLGNGPLLLDFDGPICGIFAGDPASEVAQHLVRVLQAEGIDLPAAVAGESDPLEVLRWAGVACPHALVVTVEEALCAAEVRAADTASPTPYGHEVIRAARLAGIPTAIVSNNSARAITTYLTSHGLRGQVGVVIGRPHASPAHMKPHPTPILQAASALTADVGQCVLVGDSLSDIESAHAAGARIIAYANRPWKIAAFSTADAVVTSMAEVLAAIPPAAPRA